MLGHGTILMATTTSLWDGGIPLRCTSPEKHCSQIRIAQPDGVMILYSGLGLLATSYLSSYILRSNLSSIPHVGWSRLVARCCSQHVPMADASRPGRTVHRRTGGGSGLTASKVAQLRHKGSTAGRRTKAQRKAPNPGRGLNAHLQAKRGSPVNIGMRWRTLRAALRRGSRCSSRLRVPGAPEGTPKDGDIGLAIRP